jgi:hypothetical protein
MLTRQLSVTRALLAAGLLTAALALTGCFAGGDITAEEVISESFPVGAAPRVVVETFNGRIDVNAGTDGQVAVEATKRGAGFTRAEAEDDLKNVLVTMTQEGDTLRIRAERTDAPFVTGNTGASFVVSVPTGAALELRTSNGQITTFDVTGDVFAQTSNGEIDVRGGAGRLDLGTSNGRIEIEARDARVDAGTSNGRISFRGSLAEGDHRFDTSNGSIDITLPSDARFRIDASTSNGDVSTEFPVTVSGSLDDNELRGTVGENPSVSIIATSSNGSIDIRQGE